VFVIARYRKYSKELKLQASRLVTEQGYSYQQAAKRLGTTGWSIRNWMQKRGIVKSVFSNLELDGVNLCVDYNLPFEILAKNSKYPLNYA
jgi:hypothetical protein